MYIGLYKTPNKALSCLLSCKQKKLSSFKSPDEGLPIPCSILYNVLKLKKASKFKKYFERSLLYSFLTKLCKPLAYRRRFTVCRINYSISVLFLLSLITE